MKIGEFVRRMSLALVWTATGCELLFAGFASTEAYLAAVGRVPGQGGAQFYTTVWASNLTTAPQTLTFQFLKQGQANPSPASFQDTLQPGETRVYENVVESRLGLNNAIGAARVTSTGEIFVSERIYNQAPGDDVGRTEGLFFAGVPKSFSISAGESASIQGIDQGGSENFRYNFALIETGGGSPTVNVQVFDGDGTLLGQKAYPLLPYEQLQPSVADVVPGIHTANARITATVTGGSGSVLLAGAQLANESQDSSGFEMTFRDELLGTGGTGAAIIHDSTLTGDGTSGSPLGVNPASVVTSVNGLHGGLALAAGSNVTITPNGSTLTISSSGGGGGLTLPFSGTAVSDSSPAFKVSNNGAGGVIEAQTSIEDSGAFGISGSSEAGIGVLGHSNMVDGVAGSGSPGVSGDSASGNGVFGVARSSGYGVKGLSVSGYGVYGQGAGGVSGYAPTSGYGVYGQGATAAAYAVYASGSIGATGVKNFVEPHPTDPAKEIRYVCLEGPEAGTYFRGSGRIVGGTATIEVPEDFRMVSSEKGLTVQLTALGAPASLWVVSESLDRITVQGSSDVEFHYTVNGVRKAFADFRPVAENRDFVPRSPRDERFTAGLPAESVRRLKASGILNIDGTINIETAHRLGWDEQDSWKRTEAETERK
jgi:hypothetical protein